MISIKNLTKEYENGNIALDDISVEIGEVGMVALVGTSGAGKSTLLNILSLNDDKTAGEITYNGISYEDANKKVLAKNFSMVYQDYKLIENMSVYDNLKVAIELAGLTVDRNNIEKILDDMDIKKYIDEKVLNLSGGQKQRVAIARSILVDASVIFADEPTGNLDSKNSAMIFKILKGISKEKLVIVVTHDVEGIKDYADRIIELSDGKIINDNVINNVEVNSHKQVSGTDKNQRKGKLSFSSAFSLAKSLYGGKKIRRITFSIASIILIVIMSILSIISMLSYEKIAYATYKKNDDLKPIVLQSLVRREFGNENDSEVRFYTAKLDDAVPFIDEEIKGKTAKVADIITDENMIDGTHNIDLTPISMYDYLNYSMPEKIIFMDNPSDYGVKIIKGNAPDAIDEIAISDGAYEYVGAVGYINQDGELKRIKKEDIIGLEIGGVKIVGVFDDGFSVDEKFKNVKADEPNHDKDFLLGNKYFVKCVIAHTSREAYYNYVAAFTHNSSSENELSATLRKGEEYSENIRLIPYNDMTKHLVGDMEINRREVILGSNILANATINVGDTINVKTDIVEKVLEENKILKNITNKDLRVKNISERMRYVVVHQDDFNELSADFTLPTYELLVYKENLALSDMENIYNHIVDNYVPADKHNSGAKEIFIFNNSEQVLGTYEDLSRMNIIVICALIVISFIYIILACNILNVSISAKANELFILKSLGAKSVDYYKIYGMINVIQLLLEIVLGALTGSILVTVLSNFIATLLGVTCVVLPIDIVAILIIVGVVIAVNQLSLSYNILKIRRTNLRKSFQKVKM